MNSPEGTPEPKTSEEKEPTEILVNPKIGTLETKYGRSKTQLKEEILLLTDLMDLEEPKKISELSKNDLFKLLNETKRKENEKKLTSKIKLQRHQNLTLLKKTQSVD
jgi:hypothetical protein